MKECKNKSKVVAPTQHTRPTFIPGHVYKIEGSQFLGLNCFYLATKQSQGKRLFSLSNGNCWSSHDDGPFGDDLATHHVWTDVTATVCIDTGE